MISVTTFSSACETPTKGVTPAIHVDFRVFRVCFWVACRHVHGSVLVRPLQKTPANDDDLRHNVVVFPGTWNVDGVLVAPSRLLLNHDIMIIKAILVPERSNSLRGG